MKEEMIRFCLWWVMDSASYTESWEEIAVLSLSRWSLDETSVLDRVQIIGGMSANTAKGGSGPKQEGGRSKRQSVAWSDGH